MVLTGLLSHCKLSLMFERFTRRARHVVVLSQEEARRLHHNYIGTEHILLGLLAETEGVASRVLDGLGISLDGTRQDIVAIVGSGKSEPSGHIPFTPRAKKTLELALREALQLHHNYIGTEHILLGVIREGKGVGAQILQQHAKLSDVRAAVLDAVPTAGRADPAGRRWLRRRGPADFGGTDSPEDQSTLSATPAADTTLSEAARLAGTRPVGSHHLLLAALGDADSAAARVLATLGVDLDRAKSALRTVDVTGTSDEQPEEAGRRQMIIHVSDDSLTIESADPVILSAARATLEALGDEASAAGTIRGDAPYAASMTAVWLALHDSLDTIRGRSLSPGDNPVALDVTQRDPDDSESSGTDAA